MRVLLAHEAISLIGGGSQMAVVTWMKNLKQLGVKVKLLCNKPMSLAALEDFIPSDVILNKSINLGFIYPQFSIAPFLSSEVIDKIKKFNPQIIHFHEPLLVSFALHKLASELEIKTIGSYHTNFAQAKVNRFPLSLIFKKEGFLPKLLDKIQLYLLLKSEFLTAPSNFYQKLLSQRLKRKTFILPYPIPNYFFLKKITIPKKINKLITVSRLSGEKNVDLLIEMMRYLGNRFTLTIVGEGVDRTFLENKVKKLGLDKFIEFTGWVKNEDLPEILKKHHLFISSSDYETFGITYIEALATGLPCMAFDYPVSQEIIPRSMAIFVKTLKPKAWADRLLKTQNNPLLYQRLRQNITKNYKKLSLCHELNSTKRLIEIYNKILSH